MGSFVDELRILLKDHFNTEIFELMDVGVNVWRSIVSALCVIAITFIWLPEKEKFRRLCLLSVLIFSITYQILNVVIKSFCIGVEILFHLDGLLLTIYFVCSYIKSR